MLEHLTLLDSKLEKLEALIDEHNTELYTYRIYKRHFKGKLRQMLLLEMKAKPDHYFTVNELIKLVLIQDGQEPIIQPQHTVSMRGALKYWLDKGVVERFEQSVIDVRWKLKR